MIVELIILLSALVVILIIAFVFARPASKLHTIEVSKEKKPNILTIATVVTTILFCVIPMNLSPAWKGEMAEHRDQYEKITESFLNGHVYFDYEVNESLEKMENPYSPEERKEKQRPVSLESFKLYREILYVF